MEEEKTFHFYWDSSSPFSDDYISEFVVDDIVFCFLNQYMFYKKADFFGDEDKKREALDSNTPSDLKPVDQRVKNFNADQWYYESYRLYEKGINAKYTQNKSLRRLLVESYPKYIFRIHESSRHRIINSDPSYLNSEEFYERQWKNFLLMQLRNNMIFKDTDLYKSVTEPFDENMAAQHGFYSDQYVGDKNDQSCPDGDSQTDPKLHTTAQTSMNSEEQRGTSPGKNGADTECKYPDPSETLDNNEGRGIMDNKSFSNETTEDKHANSESVTQEQMESNRGEYSRCHDNGSVESEQQGNNDKTLKEKDNSVVETDSFVLFSGEDCPFSDDHICEFRVDGVTFHFISQYMFYCKSYFFQDEMKMKAALQAQNGKEIAAVDNSTEPVDQRQWLERCKSIYETGLKAKFSQSKYLKDKLMGSQAKIILEVPKQRDRQEIIDHGPEILKGSDFQSRFWKEMVLMSVRDKLVRENISMTDESKKTTSSSKKDNDNDEGLKQENNNGKPSNSQNSTNENSDRVSKKDRKNFKYRPLNLYFYNDNSGLSNGYECDITLNHINFRSIDEYMLYRKAELFQDESVKEKILRGEEHDWNVNNFDRDIWFKKRKELYLEGIQAKFSQNPDLKNLLLKTHPKTIVYARTAWVKDEIYWYGLDDWYMNKHHWSEVLQMKLRDELIAETEGEKERKSEAYDNESAHNRKSSKGKETKEDACQEDNMEGVTIPKSQSSKRRKHRSRDMNKDKEKKNQPQPSIDDNENGSGDDHRNPDEHQGNTDLLPEGLNSGEHIVVKVDSTGQRKTEIESIGVENTPNEHQSTISKESESGGPKDTATNTDKVSWTETDKTTCSMELEENSKSAAALNESQIKTRGTSDTQITASGKSKKRNSYKARRRTPELPTNNSERLPEISHNDKTQKQSESKTFQKQKKPLSRKEKNENYRERTLENIPRKDRCVLVDDGSELSADFQCQFNIDGVEFYSVTQYIQYCKADYFHDDELKAKIMKSTDGLNGLADEITVQNFDPEAWYTEKAEDVTWSANEAKFMQNGHLKQILYDTYPSIIQDVAVQSDTNIPLSRKSQRTQYRLKSVLTELRDELMRSENLIY